MNKQHYQLPNDMTKSGKLVPTDLLVYVTLKRFYNSKTKLCFPGLRKVSDTCKLSIPTIRKSIDSLEEEMWISVVKKDKGYKQYYYFKPYTNFEVFSPEFLDNPLVSPKEKAYIMSSQQHMYKDSGVGNMSYNNKELSSKINLSKSLISRRDKDLEDKGLLLLHNDKSKTFELNALGQEIIFTLQNHDDEISDLKKEVRELKRLLNGEITL